MRAGATLTLAPGLDDLDFTTPRPAEPEPFEVVAVLPRRAKARNRVAIVVDGDLDTGEATATLLRNAGYHAVVETSPRDAARHMSGLGLPELVLLETELPQMSGLDFLARIRGNRRVKDTIVVMYAAHATRSDVVRALNLGADGFISKSVAPDAFLAAVARLLGG